MQTIYAYCIYFIIYGYIFLLFLKGYYPANETGILFIGFLIFMSLAYNFVGSIIGDELENKRKELFSRFESLFEENNKVQDELRDVFAKISKQKNTSRSTMSIFATSLAESIVSKFTNELNNNLNSSSNNQLFTSSKEQLTITKDYLNIAYLLSVKQLVENKLELENK